MLQLSAPRVSSYCIALTVIDFERTMRFAMATILRLETHILTCKLQLFESFQVWASKQNQSEKCSYKKEQMADTIFHGVQRLL